MADTENHRLQLFQPDGHLQSIIGERGSRPHQLNHPLCVTLTRDKAQNIIVTDSVNACVKVITLTPHTAQNIIVTDSVNACVKVITLNPDAAQNIIVTDSVNACVKVIILTILV